MLTEDKLVYTPYTLPTVCLFTWPPPTVYLFTWPPPTVCLLAYPTPYDPQPPLLTLLLWLWPMQLLDCFILIFVDKSTPLPDNMYPRLVFYKLIIIALLFYFYFDLNLILCIINLLFYLFIRSLILFILISLYILYDLNFFYNRYLFIIKFKLRKIYRAMLKLEFKKY